MRKLLNPNAGGIDISAKEHVVAVPEDSDRESIRTFSTYTEDLHRLAKWLIRCGVGTVAMESTGVYWYHLYTVLLEYGMEVYLVNAYHVKNVPGRKSDVSDARWLQQLHSFGLLKGSFQPDNLTRELRDYTRLRKTVIRDMGIQIQRVQKALEYMNIKLAQVMRDITGTSGTAMIEAVLRGERDPEKLVLYADRRLKTPREKIKKALMGNWRDEQLFNLGMAWDQYSFLLGQLAQCDKKIEQTLVRFAETQRKELEDKGPKTKNQPRFNVKNHLFQVFGVDVTEIDGFKGTTALTVFSETGPRLKEKFKADKHFLSWLNLVPDNKITGGKVIYSKVKRKKNKAGQAFREAANALWNSKSPLGDYLRRKKARSGGNRAIVATARKIASVYYKMVTEKVSFDRTVLKTESQENLIRKIAYLEKSLESTKLQLTV